MTFTKGLSSHLISRGIRVNCIAPGPVWTPLVVASFPNEMVRKHVVYSPGNYKHSFAASMLSFCQAQLLLQNLTQIASVKVMCSFSCCTAMSAQAVLKNGLVCKSFAQNVQQVCLSCECRQVCISAHADLWNIMHAAYMGPTANWLTHICQAECCVTACAVLLAADRDIRHRHDADRTACTAQGIWPPRCVPCCRVRLKLCCWSHFECHRRHAHQLGAKQMTLAQNSKLQTL